MKALILAAGYGTRMEDLHTPKQLLEIKYKTPVIEEVTKNIAKANNIDEVYVITNNKFYPQIKDWATNSEILKIKKISLINNQTNKNEERLGSIGDIWYALEHIGIPKEGLMVAQGDDLVYGLYFSGLVEKFINYNSTTIVTHRLKIEKLAKRFGVVETDEENRVINIKEKPKLEEIKGENGTALANGGYYLFTKEDLKNIETYRQEIESKNKLGEKLILDKTGLLLSWMVEKNRNIYSYEHEGSLWWDVGTKESLEAARKFYSSLESKESKTVLENRL